MVIIFNNQSDKYFFKLKKWLKFYSCPFKVIDLNLSSYSDFNIEYYKRKTNISLKLGEQEVIDFNQVSLFFYRNGWPKIKKVSQINFDEQIANAYFEIEQKSVFNSIFSTIQHKTIGWLSYLPLNKLSQLTLASSVGLQIPSYLLTTKRETVQTFFGQKQVIVKAIQENIAEGNDKEWFYQGVKKVDLNTLPYSFELTFFQEYIEKEIEIRCFYLNGNCYSIGSICENEAIDLREHYESQHNYKFKLSEDIESKIELLMERLGLIAGSIDLIISKTGTIYFLEVNTEGQYDGVSYLGNYGLDEKLAKFCLQKENELING